jgi:hypothetical protein
MKDLIAIFSICIGIVVLIFVFVLVLQFVGVILYSDYQTPKTTFVIGQCYEIANQDNPFIDKYFIKVVNIKNGYIQYFYSSSPSILSSYKMTDVERMFKPVECGKLKED